MARLTVVRIQANLQWRCFTGQGGHWIGVCEPLKLTVQGDTWAELMEDIGNTLDAMLKDLLQSNELEKFLRDHNWSLIGPIPVRPKAVRFDVPFIPAMMGAHGSQANLH
jgi:predicted RNase H-like HicB family nuclease